MENEDLVPSLKRLGKHDPEFCSSVIEQCKQLMRSESFDDWYMFVDLVTRSLDRMDTNTIGKIHKLIGQYTGYIGKQQHRLDANVKLLLFGKYPFYGKTVKVDYPEQGFQRILESYMLLRYYITGGFYGKSNK